MAPFAKIQQRLKNFDFVGLFTQEIGWNHFKGRDLDLQVDDSSFKLTPVAEQSGLAVYVCAPASEAEFPDYATRRKIETRVAKLHREHIVIYQNPAKTLQIWQWVKREAGKASACREQRFEVHQTGDALIQKLFQIKFALEDEPTIGEARQKVQKAFDIEKVTKKFYDEFKTQHAAFLKFLKGIPDEHLQRWYVSVMLNRLMFIYFIQKKGFLGGDQDYLRNKLDQSKRNGKNGFYRGFLCPLFFEGFARREEERSAKTTQLLGAVPYLNGGLFLKHQIEQAHGRDIEIPDLAFEKIFAFFDKYQWHLDDRPTRAGNEISPDVLGYVFEKYINQREMGAYYTKEDITGYISQNTIIPAVFDAARKGCKVAFEGDQAAWRLLKEDPDRYFYAAVLQGTSNELPKEIAAGIKDVSQRGDWNRTAPEEYGLPTETWREVVARRQRHNEVRAELVAGKIQTINDFVTYNLDIQRFAEEVISNAEGADLVWAFYKAVEKLSVLDPTCGSGAFLFAGLNILEKLYDTCLVRMQAFVDDLDRSGEKHSAKKFEHFRLKLAEMNDKTRHPSPRYFILKSIILNNLYGVDIMEEATEICKLRLFLKLVAQVNATERIEPLPDIDFNIRSGNTLVGFANETELETVLGSKFDYDKKLTDIKERAELARKAFEHFRDSQVTGGTGSAEEISTWKGKVQDELGGIRSDLDDYLAGEYNIAKNDKGGFRAWRNKHQPFHWFIEFYGIVSNGGFDVIIGNPPYLELKEVDYVPKTLATVETSAIHAMCIERSASLLTAHGNMSMIVPLAIVSTQRMKSVQNILENTRSVWYSNFSWRPGKLFDTVNRALTIFVAVANTDGATYSTSYQKWTSETRPALIPCIAFLSVPRSRNVFWVPKLGAEIEHSILSKMLSVATTLRHFIGTTQHRIYYRTTGGLYWKVFTDFAPAFRVNGKKGHSSRETWITVGKQEHVRPIIAALSSDVFWWWYTITSNCRDVNPSDLHHFPVPAQALQDKAVIDLGGSYLDDLIANSTMLIRNQKQTGKTETQSFKIQRSKPIINDIDAALAKHYGFSVEEVDFIKNYEVKYRLGTEDDEDADSASA